MSIYEASITNPKKQLEFYKDLSEQLQRENRKLKERMACLERSNDRREDTILELRDDFTVIDEYEDQRKKFIKYLEDMLEDENDIFSVVRVKDVLSKYKEIIGGLDDKID